MKIGLYYTFVKKIHLASKYAFVYWLLIKEGNISFLFYVLTDLTNHLH